MSNRTPQSRVKPFKQGYDSHDSLGTARQELEPLLVGRDKAAALLGISERKLSDLVLNESLPHVRIGMRVLFSIDDLHAWIEDRRQVIREQTESRPRAEAAAAGSAASDASEPNP